MSNNIMKNADMPAMPQSFSMSEEDCGTVISHLSEADMPMNIGLTKREVFAMHAMNGYLSNSECLKTHINHAQTAEKAVLMADALLAELEK